MSGFQIRKAQADDLPAMQAIARRTIDKCYRKFLGDEGVDWFINSGESDRELEKHMEQCDVLVEDEVVAFAICFDDLVHLMMVDVSLQRTGLGRLGSMLLAHCENRLFTQGYSPIRLETFAGNHQATRLYRKNGWCVTKKEIDEKHGFMRVFFEKKPE
jgi:ribosomal protein S18 acetylase RimI-like enzyme